MFDMFMHENECLNVVLKPSVAAGYGIIGYTQEDWHLLTIA
jgi:hypothetical protein